MSYKLRMGDCIEWMSKLKAGSVDLILCDPPYGTTACKWDVVIPFEPMWEQIWRVLKPNGACVLFGSEPFSSALRLSSEHFKYDWVWEKSKSVGFVNAKLKPMNKHEVISVFSTGKTSNGNDNNMTYYPQGLLPYGKTVKGHKKSAHGDNDYFRPSQKETFIQEFTNYPNTVLRFSSEGKPVHPTQKPVALLEYLIRTYTNEGETVLDFACGSGSTGVAAINTGRSFLGIERDEKYFTIAENRIKEAADVHTDNGGTGLRDIPA
jgi:site-specific DNA-methyltransferase (adenine-specific)